MKLGEENFLGEKMKKHEEIINGMKAYGKLLSWYINSVFRVCCTCPEAGECDFPCGAFLGCSECEERRGEPVVDESRD